jgi:hypothetical protein
MDILPRAGTLENLTDAHPPHTSQQYAPVTNYKHTPLRKRLANDDSAISGWGAVGVGSMIIGAVAALSGEFVGGTILAVFGYYLYTNSED